MRFDQDRINRIRTALLNACFKPSIPWEDRPDIVVYKHSSGASCMLPLTVGVYVDTNLRAAECIRTLIDVTDGYNQYLELGPLTKREQAYQNEIDRLNAKDKHPS